MGESKRAYILENHIEDIEDMIHKFTTSTEFLNFLLEQGHNIDPNTVTLKKKDIEIGEDIDIYVKHITEHQNFSMLLIPISIYSLGIYDTLLFSVIEVTDEWLDKKYYKRENWNNPVDKPRILAEENHNMLKNHMYDQAMQSTNREISEIQIDLHESYISSNEIKMHMSHMSDQEKKNFKDSWGIMKKIVTHNIDMNVEMNLYLFGRDDMNVIYLIKDKTIVYRITPSNIFRRHHFSDSQ